MLLRCFFQEKPEEIFFDIVADKGDAFAKAVALFREAGTNFLENTYGLHRGFKPKEKERLLFQVRYSIHGSSFRYREQKRKVRFKDKAVSFSYIN